ncbi:hypothetical protein [Paractinoplanes rishiriensis]|uniref:Uncharacterized protein n=1 Tax=Paractinoplanes rishiriensis TaxID=1050105 RepID=A0A919JZB3_9ACTN|nr:hypothetical protein [Actinoplanes rishiriensis]GIE95838.1 hypothetical protein Ari01nite_33030 [Actinoplanes rishiriensis]
MSAPDATTDADRPTARGILLALICLLWMAAMLWSARASITSRGNAEAEVTSTAYALPGVVSAGLVTGAAAGLAVLALLSRRRTLGTTARFAVTTGTGLLIGLLGAVTIVTINTEGWIYAVVGGTIAAAATIGGGLAGVRVPQVVTAICWAAVAVFVVGFVVNLFQDPLLGLLGSGDSRQSQADAARWFTFFQAAVSGLAAGLTAYALLRRGPGGAAWPWYAVAGAGPGLLLVVGELLTRTAGSRVLDLAGRVSDLELVVQRMLSGARFNSALVVLFVGAVTAMVAIGRTIKPAPDDAETEPVPATK